MRLLSIVGARPQFVKAAVVSHAIERHNESSPREPIFEELVHTGQHYDDDMSRVFFQELGIPEPVVNLGIGSGRHGETTGRMLTGIECEIVRRCPDWVLVYGDTNSTLAGALAAAKLDCRVVHVEAGLRSFNRRMPEELNRVVADHLSSLLLCPTRQAVENLAKEGIVEGVHHVGDVMFDAGLAFGGVARDSSVVHERLGLRPGGYYLATVHRAENTDDPRRLREIFVGLGRLAEQQPVVLPLHPRTRTSLGSLSGTDRWSSVRLTDPVSFLDMIRLEQDAEVILTDSGGVQKEAYFHGVPCVTLRDETEWIETVEHGWNQLAGASADRIVELALAASTGDHIDDYGTGHAAEGVVELLAAQSNHRSGSATRTRCVREIGDGVPS